MYRVARQRLLAIVVASLAGTTATLLFGVAASFLASTVDSLGSTSTGEVIAGIAKYGAASVGGIMVSSIATLATTVLIQRVGADFRLNLLGRVSRNVYWPEDLAGFKSELMTCLSNGANSAIVLLLMTPILLSTSLIGGVVALRTVPSLDATLFAIGLAASILVLALGAMVGLRLRKVAWRVHRAAVKRTRTLHLLTDYFPAVLSLSQQGNVLQTAVSDEEAYRREYLAFEGASRLSSAIPRLSAPLTLIVMFVSVATGAVSGAATAGTIIGTSSFVAVIVSLLSPVADLIRRIQVAAPNIWTIEGYLKTEVSLSEVQRSGDEDAIVSVRDLVFEFPQTGFRLTCRHFDLLRKEVVLVEGANGSGKSTFLRLLGLLYQDRSDSVRHRFTDSNITAEDWRKRVVYLSLDSMIITDNLLAALSERSELLSSDDSPWSVAARVRTTEVLSRAMVAVKDCGVGDLKNLSRGQLSWLGMLLPSVFDNAEILLIDELDSSMDPLGRATLAKQVNCWNREERTVLLVSHHDFRSSLEGLGLQPRLVQVLPDATAGFRIK